MNLFYHISPYPALSEDMVAKIYEASSPNAEIGSQTIPAPHNTPVSVTWNGLDKVTHIVRLFTAVTATLLHKYDAEPKENFVTIFDDIKFIVGDGQPNSPVQGDVYYTNPALAGLDIDEFRIWRNGYGFLYPGVHYTFIGTTWTLVGADEFNDEEEFLITRRPKAVETIVNDSVVGKQFGGNTTIPDMFVDVVSTVNYAPEHLRHLIRLAGANANYVFPLGANIPIGYMFRITNFGASSSPSDKGKVTFANAPLLWGGSPKTEIEIPFTGAYEFEFDGTNWNCTMFNSTGGSGLPQIIYSGSVVLATMTSLDQLYTITLPFTLSGYNVIGNLASGNINWNDNNDVMFIVYNQLATQFSIAVRRVARDNQKLRFNFIIVA